MLVPTFDCPILGSCYPEPSNGFTVIALGSRKSAEGVNLASASPAKVVIAWRLGGSKGKSGVQKGVRFDKLKVEIPYLQ